MYVSMWIIAQRHAGIRAEVKTLVCMVKEPEMIRWMMSAKKRGEKGAKTGSRREEPDPGMLGMDATT